MSETEEHQGRHEDWVYRGKRQSWNDPNKLVHEWLRPDGNVSRWQAAPKFAIVGATYRVEVFDETQTARIQGAERVLEAAMHNARPEWLLAEHAEEGAVAARKLNQKLAKDNTPLGELTLSEVRELYARRRTFALRTALLAAVLTYLEG